uniref:Mastoparan n=1 Tax=Vespa orientalis TaxID=7447 RepID=MAST_VESOR|nr:RecName: Full=Mastoparan; AltName: Full=Histamine-releasing peptide I; Short=HR-1; Short=HR-I; Short=HR1; Flags: Precursor [Vespa orientalis]AIK26613.1 prepromastoparan [Vespa orientalis]
MKDTILILFTAFIALLGFFGMSAEALADPLADPSAGPNAEADPEAINLKAIAALVKKVLG